MTTRIDPEPGEGEIGITFEDEMLHYWWKKDGKLCSIALSPEDTKVDRYRTRLMSWVESILAGKVLPCLRSE